MNPRHQIQWTLAAIAEFWDSYESTDGMDLWHFSKQRGRALMRYVERRVRLVEPVLDLGCGSGHLISVILKKQLACYGADVNQRAVEMVEKKFAEEKLFRGARFVGPDGRVPFNDCAIGTIFLLETIEHLLPATLEKVFSEIFRALVPGGALIITAPYREDLASSDVRCSSCNAVFHKTQHIRSLDEKTVETIVRESGLRVIACGPALLLPSWGVWLAAQMARGRAVIACPGCGARCESPNRSVFRREKSVLSELKHLVCIAEKRAGSN